MKKQLFIILSMALFISCGDESKKNALEVKTVDNKTEIHKSGEMTAEFEKPIISEIYENYGRLKTALVNSDMEGAQKGAKRMESSLSDLKGFEELREMTNKIANVSDLQTQREVFQFLTEEMMKLTEEHLTDGAIYVQYCPMAFDGKGAYWLSNVEQIRNPYYGDRMLKCGEVKDIIEIR